MTVQLVDPLSSPLWEDLIYAHPYSSIFHSPQWLRVLSRTYQFDIKACVKTNRAGFAVAGMPFCRLDDHKGKRIMTIPFADFSDSLVQSLSEWQELVEPLLAENCPIITRTLHNNIPLGDDRFVLTKVAKWHGIDLEANLETIWAGLHESARRAIRKSESMGIRVRIAEYEELRDFFELHLRVRKYKYHLLAQPYAFFDNIWKDMVDNNQGLVFLAEQDGQVIGSLFFLSWRDVFTYKFSASSQDELLARPTDIMLWEAIKYAKTMGFKSLDLGLSDWEQDGLIRFKRKYANEEKIISFLRYTPPDYVSPPDPLAVALSCLTEVLTREGVPDWVTEEAGNLLYRFFV